MEKELILFYHNPTLEKIKNIYKLLNEKTIDINTIFPIFGNLTLMHIKQPYETMKYLLDRGGNANISDNLNLKPIHFQYNFETIKLLVKRGSQTNPKDLWDFNPLFWQKDPESIRYLLKYNEIYNNFVYTPKNWPLSHHYNKMLIDGGYDPYNEYNISITPIFLQRNRESLYILLDHCYMNNIINVDLAHETLLFKASVNKDIIEVFYENNQDLDHQNILGNTPLHVQSDLNNIYYLLKYNANHKIINNEGLTSYEYHKRKNNFIIYEFIKQYTSAKIIQEYWRSFWFKKRYVPPKYFKIKKQFLDDFVLLPPSECGKFPGGIGYQNAFEDYLNIMKVY